MDILLDGIQIDTLVLLGANPNYLETLRFLKQRFGTQIKIKLMIYDDNFATELVPLIQPSNFIKIDGKFWNSIS
jgi:hypothetical protein